LKNILFLFVSKEKAKAQNKFEPLPIIVFIPLQIFFL
jgi:hypothetical protein